MGRDCTEELLEEEDELDELLEEEASLEELLLEEDSLVTKLDDELLDMVSKLDEDSDDESLDKLELFDEELDESLVMVTTQDERRKEVRLKAISDFKVLLFIACLLSSFLDMVSKAKGSYCLL